jgi:hypothetical protein
MTLVENELIEDFSRGSLPAGERQRFKRYFLVTPERREKLNFVEAMALSAAADKKKEDKFVQVFESAPAYPPASSWWESLLAFMRSSNLFAGAAAASVLLFLAVGAFLWFSQRAERQEPLIATAPTNESTQSLNQPSASTQIANTVEIGNASPSATTTPKLTTTVSQPQSTKSPQSNQEQRKNENPAPTPVVKPTENAPPAVVFAFSVVGLTRSGGSSVEKKIEPGVKFVELQLPLDPDREYEDFRVIVQNSDGKVVGQSKGLKTRKKGNGKNVIASMSAAPFEPDDYTVILSGKTNGVYEEAARYSFRVLK